MTPELGTDQEPLAGSLQLTADNCPNIFPISFVSPIEDATMYCNSCGKAIAEDARFCAHCGNAVGHSHGARKFFRSRSDRKIAGVCAGTAHYFDLDTSLVRILWVLVTFAVGILPGLIAYIVAWIIVPEELVAPSAVVPGIQPVTG